MHLKLDRLAKNRVFIDNIRWDVTPEVLFQPRFVSSPDKCDLVKETQGFMFYIDRIDDTASLMVMKTYELRSKTVGEVADAPKDIISRAVETPASKPIAGMYPISGELEKWLKKGLGIS